MTETFYAEAWAEWKRLFGSLLLGEESFQGNFILCGFEVRECGHKDKNKEYKV